MKVVVVPNRADAADYADGFHHAVEVYDNAGEIVHRWTFQSVLHAQQCRARVADWFRYREDFGVPPIITVVLLIPWPILAMAGGILP